jgi:hypothetical protein
VRRVNSRGVLMEPWTTIRVRFSGWPAPEVIGRDRRAGVGQGAGTPVAGVFGWYERRAKALTGPTTRLSFCLVAVVSAATLRGARKGRRASESNGRSADARSARAAPQASLKQPLHGSRVTGRSSAAFVCSVRAESRPAIGPAMRSCALCRTPSSPERVGVRRARPLALCATASRASRRPGQGSGHARNGRVPSVSSDAGLALASSAMRKPGHRRRSRPPVVPCGRSQHRAGTIAAWRSAEARSLRSPRPVAGRSR